MPQTLTGTTRGSSRRSMVDSPKIYMDSCCFIDMVKTDVEKKIGDERENDVWHMKQLLEAHRDNEVVVYTSTLTIAECLHVGETPVSDRAKALFSRLLVSGQYLHLVQTTPFIAQDARDLNWKRNISLRGADGIHVASALDRGCQEFLGNDNRIKRVSKYNGELKKLGLSVRAGGETTCLPAKYRQLGLTDEPKH